jgi:hypothetical protein
MPTVRYFIFCFLAPSRSVPDGRGGLVPFHNSRVIPDGSLRLYDPFIDQPPPPVQTNITALDRHFRHLRGMA